MRYFVKKSNIRSKGCYLQIYMSMYTKERGSFNLSYKPIGYVSDLIAKGHKDPFQYAQELVDELNKGLEETKEQQIDEVSTLKYAGHFLPKAMFDYLNMDKDMEIVTKPFCNGKRAYDFIKIMVYAQILDPGSKYHAYADVIPSIIGATNYSYDQVLDSLHYIGINYQMFIEILNRHIAKKYKRNLNTALFDCTNYYFEIDKEDEIRKKGKSKENRKDPIIGQALLLDGDMIPLDMELYSGNRNETQYLRRRIEDMKNRNEVKGKVVQIADKGLNCARNIYAAVIEANDGYIFSKSVHGRNLSSIEKQWVLLEDNLANKWTEVRGRDGKLIYKYKECIDEFEYSCKVNEDDKKETKFKVKEKRVVSFNPALARKQRNEIDKMVAKARNKMSVKKVLRDEMGDSSKYVIFSSETVNGEKAEIATSINEAKINEDLEYAGYNLIVSSEINKSAKEIYNAYHALWRIEHSFKIMKTELETRPVYVSTTESIHGHFLIVYIALTIMRLLELKIFKDDIPMEQLFKFVRQYKLTLSRDGSYINNATSCETYKLVKERLGLTKLGNVYLQKKDVENIMNVKL